MKIMKADKTNIDKATEFALKLWPEHTWEQLYEEFKDLLLSEKDEVFLAKVEDVFVGFVHISIRHDYVEGSNTSPVGYIEAIYVEKQYRKRGISKKLVEAGEQWAKALGCLQMASDTELHNVDSQRFHKKLGFKEANRIVAFIKEID